MSDAVANIIETVHNRLTREARVGRRAVEVLFLRCGREHVADVLKPFHATGYDPRHHTARITVAFFRASRAILAELKVAPSLPMDKHSSSWSNLPDRTAPVR